MLINLDMNILRSFVASVNLGSSARAAENVGRSQSAISLQFRKLEEQCGQRLFRKDGRRLVLTEDGETLYRYAVRLLNLNDEALGLIRRDRMSGFLRIGMPPDLAETWLPDLLGRFSRRHSGVIIEARVDRNAGLMEDLANGALDAVLFWHSGDLPAADAEFEVVAELPVIWVGAKDLIPADPVEEIPLVLMGVPCMFRARGTAALEDAGRNWRLAFTSQSLSSLWAAVSAGLGITIRTPEGLPDTLQVLRPDRFGLPDLGRTFLCLKVQPNASALTQRFVQGLREQIFGPQSSSAGANVPLLHLTQAS